MDTIFVVRHSPSSQYGRAESRTQLWRKEREGTFPRRVRLGGNRVGYVESELDAWIESLIAQRDAIEPEVAA